MLPERIDTMVGSMLGTDYRVLQVIGAGGMAVVYLVEHQTLLKRFAAKVLSSDLASSAEARARFTQEAHAASQLDHENIVTISDDVRGLLVSSVVKRGLERQLASLRGCYRTAARAGNATPAVDVNVRLEIDEDGAATHVMTSGTGFGSLTSCAASVLGGIHPAGAGYRHGAGLRPAQVPAVVIAPP